MQAIEERPGRETAKPVLVIADEAYVYMDENSEGIFMRARSANVGFVPVLPSAATLPTGLRDLILENTRTKTVGALSTQNARLVLSTVRGNFETDEITDMPEGRMLSFSSQALYTRWSDTDRMRDQDHRPIAEIARAFKVSRSTIYRC